jgi:hypothetical protein
MCSSEDSVWTKTYAHSGSFVFEASEFDTLYHWSHPQIAKSWHVFVIKAVDDMGGISEPDYLAFNAANIAPRTRFRTPPPLGGVQQWMPYPQTVGLRVTFRWEGYDADGLNTEVPVKYYFKSIEVTGEREWQNLNNRVRRDTTEWIEGGPSYRRVELDLHSNHEYAVAVRAVDEAGAVEPQLLLNGNLMWVRAVEGFSVPQLTLRSPAFGVSTWRGVTTAVETYEVPLNSVHDFIMYASASRYGGLIEGFSYAWDIDELDSTETDPEGKGAWTPWSISRTSIRAEFIEPRDYFLYVRCKDDGGGMTLATIHFNVVQLELSKNLCYVDDWRKYPQSSPTGEPMDDEVWQAMLEGYNYGEDWDDVSWDEWEMPIHVEMPTLEFLSQFRVVVWSLMDNRSSAINQRSAWYVMNNSGTLNVLAVYMTSSTASGERGKVWAFGRGLVESSVLGYVGSHCEYPYSVVGASGCGIKDYSFPKEFMHITGEYDRRDRTSGGASVSLFSGMEDRPVRVFVDTAGPAIPEHRYVRAPAAELYPNLPPRLALHSDGLRYRLFSLFEVLEYPAPDQENQLLFYDMDAEEMTGLVPLYRMHATSSGSKAHDKYCGFRYIPTDPGDQGEIVYFFFPMFPFDDSQIRATAKVVLSDWFGLPDPDAAPSTLTSDP